MFLFCFCVVFSLCEVISITQIDFWRLFSNLSFGILVLGILRSTFHYRLRCLYSSVYALIHMVFITHRIPFNKSLLLSLSFHSNHQCIITTFDVIIPREYFSSSTRKLNLLFCFVSLFLPFSLHCLPKYNTTSVLSIYILCSSF